MAPSHPPIEEDYPYWRRNRAAMAAATFLLTTGFGCMQPFFPLALREYGVTDHLETWVGYAQGSYFTLSFFMMPLWGVVADHYGRKPMVLRTSLGMAAVFALLPLMPSLTWFMLLFFLMGTTNGFIPATNALIATNTPRGSMGASLSVVQTGMLLGGSLGPVVGATIASMLPGYRYLFWVSAGFILAAGLLTLIFARERHTLPDQPFRMHPLQDIAIIRRLPNIRGLMFISFVNTFNFLGSTAIVSVFLLDMLEARGVTSGSAVDYWVGATVLAFTLSSVLAVPVWGRLMDRHGAQRMLAITLFTGAIGSLATVVAQTPLQLVASRAVLGLCAIGIAPAALTMTRIQAPDGMEARVLAYFAAFGALGIGAGPFIAGQIGPLVGLRAFFALNSLLLLAGFAIWVRGIHQGAAAHPEEAE